MPLGNFEAGQPDRKETVFLQGFYIDRYEVTCAEYAVAVKAGAVPVPASWGGDTPPTNMAGLPVTGISFLDATAYADSRGMTLPTAHQWEKAARGAEDARAYPWGDEFDAAKCNVSDSGFGATTPVGIYLNGASPYGCLDMAGNVWEWTRSRPE